jgi:uncharacterized protein (TIGR03083 family)
MRLTPRYDGPPVLEIDDPPDSQLAPVTRQRRRLQAMLAELTDEQWASASRCAAWTVRDVVAHLVGVNEFWTASVRAGVAGEPTRILARFDPAATPPLLVDAMHELSASDVFARFVASNDALLDTLAGLATDDWSAPSESPAGHVPVRLLAQHALWDAWVHERDVALPLGVAPGVDPDEVTSCLRYAAAVSPALAIGVGRAGATVLAVDATDPAVRFVLDVRDHVALRDDEAGGDVPCLRGDAVLLTEALSLRVPMPSSTPAEWRMLLGNLEAIFDVG